MTQTTITNKTIILVKDDSEYTIPIDKITTLKYIKKQHKIIIYLFGDSHEIVSEDANNIHKDIQQIMNAGGHSIRQRSPSKKRHR